MFSNVKLSIPLLLLFSINAIIVFERWLPENQEKKKNEITGFMQNTLSQMNIQKYFEIQVFRKLKKKYKKKPATEFILGKVAEHKLVHY